ncbi:MAG: hypothetical protein A3H98_00230 [Bacteroidetes bacterium RIFCSPLOWO2_02_FULL_36_8]|nr:MAG: hypothetical protein A3H98_00230 [Bacteroidetes bacterium RIFCSPLOWO2_02_FULL_36_8]OFY70839.1 MAG: hypothetical protein A3G23_12005 [Bacteroidetes bacterium RIFCSPLOWO2_12_FULL_37_12]
MSAQTTQDKMDFAGVKLVIEQDVTSEIEKNAYTYLQNEKYLKILIDRTDTYFPIISKILKEEKVPDDFKYLAVMESKLISDAVSSSGAEGFWQMKKETANEMGIEAGLEVDERRHIIASTHAASQYLKKNNATFNNWIYALLSYNLGLQGAVGVADYKFYSANKMIINSKTHWYIIKAISCKIALQKRVGTTADPRVILFEYKAVKGQTIQEIALNNQVDLDSVFAYNKWLKTVKIPGGKPYTVFIPLVSVPGVTNYIPRELYSNNPNPVLMTKNGLSAIQAKIGDTYEKLAVDGKITTEKLKEYNELGPLNPMYHGQICYLERKHKKPHTYLPRFHIVKLGENLWRISQNFGVESSLIRKYNKLKEATEISLAEEPKMGQKLWLKEQRPDSVGIEMLINIRENRFDEISLHDESDTNAVALSDTDIKAETPASSDTPAPNEKVYVYSLDSKPDSFPSIDSAIANYKTTNTVEKDLSEKTEIKPDNPIKPEKTIPDKPIAEAKKEEIKKKEPVVQKNTTIQKPEPKTNTKKSTKTVPSVPDGVRYHEWKQGESLFIIASKYKCTIKQILLWNNLSANAKEVGMKLLIRDPKENMGAKPVFHKVMKGETLWRISVLYKSSINQLMAWNKLGNPDLSVGQMLRVSGGEEQDISLVNTETVSESDNGKIEKSGFYVVIPGDNLFRISQKYSVPVDELMRINNLPNNHVFVGQKIRIQSTSAGTTPAVTQKPAAIQKPAVVQKQTVAQQTVSQQQTDNDKKFHIVEIKETLFGISKKYNVSIDKIRQWNNITGNDITVGEQLIVGEMPAVSRKPAGASLAATQPPVVTQTNNPISSSSKPAEHTAMQGENLMTIAKKYSVTPVELKTWNNLKTMAVVKGQVLKISDPTAEPGKHKVKPGDVLPVLAKKYNVTPDQIKTWNNLKTSALKPGQIIWVTNPEIAKVEKTPESPAVSSTKTPEPSAVSFTNTNIPPEKTNYNLPDTGNYLPDPGMKITLYSVKDGETIFQIANKYHTTVNEIMRINRLSSYTIEPGQRLTIAFADQSKFDIINHTVSQGETLYSIARQYNCKVSEILDWNEKPEMSIQIGEALKIRKIK